MFLPFSCLLPNFLDVDECTSLIHGCHYNASCNNTDGSYTCKCKTGLNCRKYNKCCVIFFRSFTDNDLCDPLKRRRRWSLIKCAFKMNTYLNHCNSNRYFIIRSKSWQREILILCKHTFPLPNEHWNNLKSTKSRSYELHLMGLGFYQGNDQELNKTSFP